MRHSILFAIMIFATSLAGAGCARVSSGAGDVDFAALEQRWMDALAEKDKDQLERLLAPDFTIVGAGSTPDDFVGDRATWLANAQRFPWPRHEVSDVRAKRHGTTAVVHAVLRAEYPPRSITPEGGLLTFLVTDVWTWRAGRWQVTSRHASLPPPPAAPATQPAG